MGAFARIEHSVSAADGMALQVSEWRPADGQAAAHRSPLLCLAGLARNGSDFGAFAPRHAARRRVLCPDLRGRGRSARDPDWRNYGALRTLLDLLDVMAACHVPRAVVVGTSVGGLLAMAIAAARPGALAGAVLNDVGPALEPGGLDFVINFVGRDHPQPDWPAAEAYLRRVMAQIGLREDALWAAFARNTFRPGPDGLLHADWDPAIARAVTAEPRRDLWPLFGALRSVPALLVRGANSPLLAAATAAEMQARKPDLGLATIAGAGHAPTLLEPELVPVLDAFLDAIP